MFTFDECGLATRTEIANIGIDGVGVTTGITQATSQTSPPVFNARTPCRRANAVHSHPFREDSR